MRLSWSGEPERGTILGLNLAKPISYEEVVGRPYPILALIECVLGVNLEPEVFDHLALSNLTRLAGDPAIIAIVKYNNGLQKSPPLER